MFSVADLIGLLGGTYSIFCTISAFFVGIFASKIYVMSLIAGFYKVDFEDSNSQELLKMSKQPIHEMYIDSNVNINQP